MFRKLALLAVVGLFCSAATVSADDDKKPAKGKFDKTKIFEKMDSDKDDKISKEEFKKFGETMRELLKDKGKGKADKIPDGLGDKVFDKIDTDKDAKINKEEFEKFDLLEAVKAKKKGDK